MKRKRQLVIFGGLILVAIVAIVWGFIYRSLAGMIIYDTNDPELMERVSRSLTREQQHVIGMSFDQISGFYLMLLVVTNVLWLGGAFYFVKSLRKDDHAA